MGCIRRCHLSDEPPGRGPEVHPTLGPNSLTGVLTLFVGHLAVSFGAKALEPKAPLSALIAASFGLDLLWPLLVITGIEVVSVEPGNTTFTPLAFVSYPWSHSLLFAIFWGVAAAGLTFGLMRNQRVGVLIGAVVVTHWILDFVTHRPDLPLWPGGPEVGLGLWNSVVATLILEGGFFLTCVVMFIRASAALDRTGNWSLWALVLLTGLIWATQPWSPPPPGSNAVAGVALILWLLPLWGRWIEAHHQIPAHRSLP